MAKKKQICARCGQPTGHTEEDAIHDDDDGGPFCEECGPNDRRSVSVWNHEGDVVKKILNASLDQVDAAHEEYKDEPLLTVVVDDER